MNIKLLRKSGAGYIDEDCNPVAYVGNLNKLLKELPPLKDAERRYIIEIADRMGVELARLLAKKCRS